MFLHSLYSKLSYFSIVLGAVFFGIRGGLIFAFLTTLGFIPHLLIFKGMGGDVFLSQFIEISLYFTIGTIVGFISGKETSLKRKYRKLSEELNISYKRLHEEAGLLIDIEERLRQNQKLSALGELSASVAHEIKNPLASIKGVSEIISDEFGDDHPKKEFMDIMESEIERLDSTVTDMLQNFTSKEIPSNNELKPFSEIVENILKLLGEKVAEKEVVIQHDKNNRVDEELIDSKRCFQIFFNIVLNSLDAVDIGGKIKMTSTYEKNNLVFIFDDNGPGIDKDKYEEVFKPFYTGKKGGTGLGLSICKKIAESLNGSITIGRSDMGGASFGVILPFKKD
jgi:signal transduction histidine kinase